MNQTEINWTELTWNPASGCEAISAGCKYCYAETLAENKRGTRAFPDGFGLTLRPHKLAEPSRVKRPSLIFTNSMSDMFLEQITDDYRDRVFDAIRAAPRHRYQMLTKRPEVAARYFSTRAVPDSVWLGVTVEHQLTIGRIDVLRRINAKVRFLSVEPMVGHVDLRDRLDGIHWVIGGGESGSHLSDEKIRGQRAMVELNRDRSAYPHPWTPRADRYHWATDLRDACSAQGAAFWWKQWGGPTPKGGGREIDGREHDGMPTHIDGAMPEAYTHREAATAAKAKRHLELFPSKTIAV
jgi:protein gp37